MTQRILSISGLRGIVGDGLSPDYIVTFAAAVGTWAKGGAVIVSHDGRPSGEMVRHAVFAGLTATGCQVLDAGIAATPTSGVIVRAREAAAGIQITASHNPQEWNGLKPFSSSGGIFNSEEGGQLLEILESGSLAWVGWDKIGTIEVLPDSSRPHLEKVLARVDAASIRARKPHVVLDCNHGSGGVMGPVLLRELGCEVIVEGGVTDGLFAHPAEPTESNLADFAARVKSLGADLGFAQDPDADRLSVIDENGRYIGEELTLALCLDHVLATEPGPVVVNGSTSRVNEDIARKYGSAFHRSFVGEAHVVAKMKQLGAVFGGEGNGGIIDPKIGYVRDSFVGMALILEGLARRGGTLSSWVDELPTYTILKAKMTCEKTALATALDALKSRFSDARPSEGDGLRLDWDDRWLQLRASNTEPIVRLIAEAPDANTAEQLIQEAKQILKPLIGE
jgi:phosphomannomutase